MMTQIVGLWLLILIEKAALLCLAARGRYK